MIVHVFIYASFYRLYENQINTLGKLSKYVFGYWSLPKMEGKFSELGELRESDKLVKHDLGSR